MIQRNFHRNVEVRLAVGVKSNPIITLESLIFTRAKVPFLHTQLPEIKRLKYIKVESLGDTTPFILGKC